MIRRPSDLGYDDGKFILPELKIEQITIQHHSAQDGFLFPVEAQTLQERQNARKITTLERDEKAAERFKESGAQFVVWFPKSKHPKWLRK